MVIILFVIFIAFGLGVFFGDAVGYKRAEIIQNKNKRAQLNKAISSDKPKLSQNKIIF